MQSTEHTVYAEVNLWVGEKNGRNMQHNWSMQDNCISR